MATAFKIADLNKEEKQLNKEMQAIGKEIGRLTTRKLLLANKVSKISKRKLNALIADECISEHAIIRYMERIEGKNLDYIRLVLAPKKVKEKIKEMKGFGVLDVGVYRLVIKGGIICSLILPPYQDDKLPDRLQLFYL